MPSDFVSSSNAVLKKFLSVAIVVKWNRIFSRNFCFSFISQQETFLRSKLQRIKVLQTVEKKENQINKRISKYCCWVDVSILDCRRKMTEVYRLLSSIQPSSRQTRQMTSIISWKQHYLLWKALWAVTWQDTQPF